VVLVLVFVCERVRCSVETPVSLRCRTVVLVPLRRSMLTLVPPERSSRITRRRRSITIGSSTVTRERRTTFVLLRFTRTTFRAFFLTFPLTLFWAAQATSVWSLKPETGRGAVG